jgi:hypothetical protein
MKLAASKVAPAPPDDETNAFTGALSSSSKAPQQQRSQTSTSLNDEHYFDTHETPLPSLPDTQPPATSAPPSPSFSSSPNPTPEPLAQVIKRFAQQLEGRDEEEFVNLGQQLNGSDEQQFRDNLTHLLQHMNPTSDIVPAPAPPGDVNETIRVAQRRASVDGIMVLPFNAHFQDGGALNHLFLSTAGIFTEENLWILACSFVDAILLSSSNPDAEIGFWYDTQCPQFDTNNSWMKAASDNLRRMLCAFEQLDEGRERQLEADALRVREETEANGQDVKVGSRAEARDHGQC